MLVKFLKDYSCFKSGDSLDMDENRVEGLLKQGIVELLKQTPVAPQPPVKKPVKK